MSREKQIEKMRDDISCLEQECRSYCKERKCHECHLYFAKMDCQNQFIAEGLTAKGYRKASDVANEIFDEIVEICDLLRDGRNIMVMTEKDFCELQKKYEGEKK